MHWNDRHFTGVHGKWSWIVIRETIRNLHSLILEFHAGQRLCITAFDSVTIKPAPEEEALGWTLLGDALVSPPLARQLQIPSGGYDEWYIFEALPASFVASDCYVNYADFHLADPRELPASLDPPRDHSRFDWLAPIQERFWRDMERLNPSSYIADGDTGIVVSRDARFVRRVGEAIREAGSAG